MKAQSVALVTGSSSGIGFETSLLLARNGYHTYASMRNLGKSKTITEISNREKLPLSVIQLDVDDDKSVKDAIYRIDNEQGRIDVVVNNAGYLLIGPLEELSIREFKEQFETIFGAIRVIKEVLPIKRRQRAGIIVNISSLAGRIGLPLNSPYVSSKFALEGLSESMAYEIEQFGIKVVLVEPGYIKTNVANSFKTGKNVVVTAANKKNNSPYAEFTQNRIAALGPSVEAGLDPIEVAKVILKAATSENPDLRYLIGEGAIKLTDIRKNTSDENFRRLIMESVLHK